MPKSMYVKPPGAGMNIRLATRADSSLLSGELALSKIQLDSWDFNTKAHTFFEGLGFEKFDYSFWRDL
jgi:hypothetical protein